MSSRLVIALDFAGSEEALAFAGKLRPEQCRLKVGLELFSVGGPVLVRELVARGFDVFLDLKFHDIPTTAARACQAAADLGVWMLNVHTLGGSAMMRAARDAIDAGARRPLLIGVTILTSHNDADVRQIGLGASPADEVARLAALAQESGLDGVVCSPHEAGVLRASRGPKFVLVTPGVRPSGAAHDDQSRTATPGEALAAGASYLVVGRPVTRAADPLRALNAIRAEMGEA